jgi:hypothetical protein
MQVKRLRQQEPGQNRMTNSKGGRHVHSRADASSSDQLQRGARYDRIERVEA